MRRCGGRSDVEFAEDFGVGTRTVRRDLKDIADAGFELAENVEPHGRIRWRLKRKTIPKPGV